MKLNGPLIIVGLVAGFVVYRLLARQAATNATNAAASDNGPQAVDVSQGIAGAPIYNLSQALSDRHAGVDTSGPSLNPSTSKTGTTSSSSASSGIDQGATYPYQNYAPAAGVMNPNYYDNPANFGGINQHASDENARITAQNNRAILPDLQNLTPFTAPQQTLADPVSSHPWITYTDIGNFFSGVFESIFGGGSPVTVQNVQTD